MTVRLIALALFGMGVIAGCDSGPDGAQQAKAAEPLSEEMALGKSTWERNCKVCHGPGLAGAPPLGDKTAWRPRIEQGLPTLVSHATEGFSGPSGHQMPARGGNPDLSDEEVARAVAYMVSQSR